MSSENPKISKHFDAYPLKFIPILKERIWGGDKLKSLGKEILADNVGESWEISAVEGDVSIVKNGIYQGEKLDKLIDEYAENIVGKRSLQHFGKDFPLLIKFLDAKTDLSIQLHPNDELAKARHNSFGKTEMWYIMDAEPQSRVILGFKENSSAEEYLHHLKEKTLPTILQEYPVSEGETYLIETGTIHAIGGGILLAEIQQTSDITYRVYDWDRKDKAGNQRELHVDLALDAIDYHKKEPKLLYESKPDASAEVVKTQYFITNYIELKKELEIKHQGETFRIYICTAGEFNIHYSDKKMEVKEGETILIPADLTNFQLQGNAKILEVYI
ncbi:MAG TPA: type I phosphomannose isomerase catalytic subunit [Flavobacterium sp.]|nr:type I phosphomannose isomerase catalytic subunit [Flavobacterium sp.]